MGKRQSKLNDSNSLSLLPNEIQDFQNISNFSDEVLIKLHDHYKRISSLQTDDGVIDYGEFSEIINKDNNMTKRIFNAIDINRDGVINFREFVKYLSCFINGTYDEKVNLSYKLFMDAKNKCIYKDQMIILLLDIVNVDDNKFIEKFITKEDIEMIVANTFLEINKMFKEKDQKNKDDNLVLSKSKSNKSDNSNNYYSEIDYSKNSDTIDFRGYKLMIEKNPQIIEWLVVDVEKIKVSKENNNKNTSKKSSCFNCGVG